MSLYQEIYTVQEVWREDTRLDHKESAISNITTVTLLPA